MVYVVFSTAQNTYTKHANTHVSSLDLGLPGTLPNVNLECVRKSIFVASILNCEIPSTLLFDRKNYYYPDLPKGYQITQSHAPIGVNGHIEVPFKGSTLEVKIHDIHLEEDSARLEHFIDESYIDYNRAGVPLLELVTEPVFHDKKEVLAFLEYIRRVYQYTDISDADMKRGQIRCDVNISLGDGKTLGTKVEIKNVNSFSNIEKVIDIEIERQRKLIEKGQQEEIIQETRRFDEKTNSTIRMRSKVDAIDYKYFVEPNIPKIKISPEWVKEIKESIPELPIDKIKRYQKFGLTEEEIAILTKERAIAEYYDSCVSLGCDAKQASNWICGQILSYLNKTNESITNIPFTPNDLCTILSKIKEGSISNKQAKEMASSILEEGKKLEDLMNQESTQMNDESKIEELVKTVIENSPKEVEAYKNGRTNLFNYFVGYVMKETKGTANPVLTKEIISKYLDK